MNVLMKLFFVVFKNFPRACKFELKTFHLIKCRRNDVLSPIGYPSNEGLQRLIDMYLKV